MRKTAGLLALILLAVVVSAVGERAPLSWEDQSKIELALAYPLSRGGKKLLSETKLTKVRFYPYVSETKLTKVRFYPYAGPYWYPQENEISVAVTSLPEIFEAFSNLAFHRTFLWESEKEAERQKNIIRDAFAASENQNLLAACFAKEKNYRDFVKFMPQFAVTRVVVWSGGNLALIPEPLREFAPWVEKGQEISWEEIANLYQNGSSEDKARLELRYGSGNPVWHCREKTLARFTDGEIKNKADGALSIADLTLLKSEEREIREYIKAKREGKFEVWERYFTTDLKIYERALLYKTLLRHPELTDELRSVSVLGRDPAKD